MGLRGVKRGEEGFEEEFGGFGGFEGIERGMSDH